MSIPVAILLIIVGAILVVVFAGKLVQGAVGTSYGFGVSAFLVSVIFLGFDPENLAVGAAGSYEGVAGIALGAIVGAAMVAFALAFGITALIAPMHFEQVPKAVLAVPIVAVIVFGLLTLDRSLSRLDGGLLLLAYLLTVLYLIWLSRRGVDIESATKPREQKMESRWKAVGLLVLALAAIVAGSEMLVAGSKTVIERLGLTDTFFGMVILALLVSIEEVARELPAALRGHPEISFGNVVGSALAFFLFNAGIIALVRPVEIGRLVLWFYLPVALASVVVISLLMARNAVPRWAGAVLVALYILFVVGGYFISETQALKMFQ